MILASREDLTSEENRQRHAALKSDVRKAGYGFIEGRRFDEKSLESWQSTRSPAGRRARCGSQPLANQIYGGHR
jgi:hypothetical protein